MLKRYILSVLICGTFFPLNAAAADRLDDLIAVWRRADVELRSLVVEFTLQTQDVIFKTPQTSNGIVKVIRTPDERLMASCEFRDSQTAAAPQDGLLYRDEHAYLMNYTRKSATVVATTGADAMAALEKSLIPCAALLHRDRLDESWSNTVGDKGRTYTILSMRRKHPRLNGWLPDSLLGVDIAILNEQIAKIPRGMPEFVRLRRIEGEMRIHITSWDSDPQVPPTADDFKKPEERDGWAVFP